MLYLPSGVVPVNVEPAGTPGGLDVGGVLAPESVFRF